jgi:predicted HicB family RNase H-like nuclease
MSPRSNDSDRFSLEIDLSTDTLEAAKIAALAVGLSLEDWVEEVVRTELRIANPQAFTAAE